MWTDDFVQWSSRREDSMFSPLLGSARLRHWKQFWTHERVVEWSRPTIYSKTNPQNPSYSYWRSCTVLLSIQWFVSFGWEILKPNGCQSCLVISLVDRNDRYMYYRTNLQLRIAWASPLLLAFKAYEDVSQYLFVSQIKTLVHTVIFNNGLTALLPSWLSR